MIKAFFETHDLTDSKSYNYFWSLETKGRQCQDIRISILNGRLHIIHVNKCKLKICLSVNNQTPTLKLETTEIFSDQVKIITKTCDSIPKRQDAELLDLMYICSYGVNLFKIQHFHEKKVVLKLRNHLKVHQNKLKHTIRGGSRDFENFDVNTDY